MGDRPLRLYVSELPAEGAALWLDGTAARHARVCRAVVGTELELFDGAGGLATARVQTLERQRMACEVQTRTRRSPPTQRLHLWLGLTKGEKPDLALRMVTELGVSSVQLVQCERSVARGERSAERMARMQTILREACAQSGHLFIPKLTGPTALSDALDQLPSWGPGHCRLALHERGEMNMPQFAPEVSEVWLMVGPEGGLSPAEVDCLIQHRFVAVGLRTPILRAETAAVVGVARALARFEEAG